MNKQRRFSIRTKLIVIYMLIAIPLIALLATSFYNQYKTLRDEAITERFDIARLTASNFSLFIDQTTHTEIIAGDTIVDEHLSATAAASLLTRIAKSRHAVEVVTAHPSPFSDVVFLDKNGVVVVASTAKIIGQNRAGIPAVKAIINGKESAIGDLQINSDGQLGFPIAIGIRRDNTLAGIISISVKADSLGSFMGTAVSQGGANIVDSSGHLIFQSQTAQIPFDRRDWSNEPFVKAALAGKTYTSTGLIFSIDRSYRMGAEIPIRNIGWAAGSFVPVESVLGPIRQTAILSALFSMVILLLTLFLAYILGERFAEGLITLKKHMQEAPRTGFTEHVSVTTGDEIGDLAESFNRMEDEILAAQSSEKILQEQLQERNEELSTLYEKQKNIASVLQESLLPKIIQKIDHLEVGLKFESATEAALVGGDFFDFVGISDRKFGIVIGDVSGKGIDAATLATTVRNTIRAFAYSESSPAMVIKKVNEIAILETPPSIFITLFYGVFDAETFEFTYTNAAHWPPIIYKSTQSTFEELKTGGLPLAMFPEAEYIDHSITLLHESIIVLYTDGVTESRTGQELFGLGGLQKAIEKYADLSPTEMAENIIKEAKAFGGGKLLDDAAVMVVKIV